MGTGPGAATWPVLWIELKIELQWATNLATNQATNRATNRVTGLWIELWVELRTMLWIELQTELWIELQVCESSFRPWNRAVNRPYRTSDSAVYSLQLWQQGVHCWVRVYTYLAISGWVSVYSSIVNIIFLLQVSHCSTEKKSQIPPVHTRRTSASTIEPRTVSVIAQHPKHAQILSLLMQQHSACGWNHAQLDRHYCFPVASHYPDECQR